MCMPIGDTDTEQQHFASQWDARNAIQQNCKAMDKGEPKAGQMQSKHRAQAEMANAETKIQNVQKVRRLNCKVEPAPAKHSHALARSCKDT